MKYKERKVDDAVILDLKGKLTIGKGDVQLRELVRDLIDRGETRIVVNLDGVSYMDSAGTGELVAAYTSCKNAGAQLRLLNVTSKTYDVLTFTQLITVFDTYTDEDEVIASFDDED